MTRRKIVGAAILPGGLLIVLSAFLGLWQRPKMVHACSGTVVDSSGKPVANARVGILTCGGETAVSYSNYEGLWQVRGLPENSEHIEHMAGYFATHPNYVGISWPISQKMPKVVLAAPVSLKVRFKKISSLQQNPTVYAELVEDYRTELAAHYGIRNISPYPSPNRKKVDDGVELSRLLPAPYKVTVRFRGKKPTVVKYIDTRQETQLWF